MGKFHTCMRKQLKGRKGTKTRFKKAVKICKKKVAKKKPKKRKGRKRKAKRRRKR